MKRTHIFNGERYERLIEFSTQLLEGRSRGEIRKCLRGAFHWQVRQLPKAQKPNSAIVIGLHYLLDTVRCAVLNYELDDFHQKLLSLVFECCAPAERMSRREIAEYYHSDKQHDALLCIAENFTETISLAQEVIDKLCQQKIETLCS